MNNDRKPISLSWLISIGVVGLVVSALVLFLYFSTFNGQLSHNQNTWGLFGDFIGGALNPILAFLGLIALLITIRLQSKELVNAAQELQKSTEALQDQSKSLKKQNLESTFFQLLKLHNDIVSDLDIRRKHDSVILHSGRDCFRQWKKQLLWRLKIAEEGVKSETEVIKKAYEKFYTEHGSDIGHYFRNLYRALKFINESDISNPSFYTGLIRAQLSSDEQFLLFYNGLSKYGENFKELIEKYSLLEHLDTSQLFDEKNQTYLYSESAYGR